MKLECYGTMTTKVNIDPVKVIHGLILRYFGTNNTIFLEGDKLYHYIDVGYHKSDYVKELVTDDPSKVELYKALNVVKEALYKEG